MKILHVTAWHSSTSTGGTELYIDSLVSSLNSCGGSNAVIVLSEKQASEQENGVYYVNPAESDKQNKKRITEIIQEFTPEVIFIHTSYKKEYLIAEVAVELKIPYFYFFHALSWLCSQANFRFRNQKDCSSFFQPLRCSVCGKVKENLMLGLLHALGAYVLFLLKLKKSSVFRVNRIEWKKKKYLIQHASKIVVFTEKDKILFLKNNVALEKIAHIPQELTPKRLGQCLSQVEKMRSGVPHFGYIGRCVSIKGCRMLVEAALKVPRTIEFDLEIYGCDFSSSYCQEIRELAAGDSRIRLQEMISAEKIPDVLGNFDVLCIPSLVFETGPFTLREGVYSGCYVIGSDQVGQREFLVKHGYLIKNNTPTGWAEVFEDCIKNIDSIRTQRNLDFSEAANMGTVATQLLDLV